MAKKLEIIPQYFCPEETGILMLMQPINTGWAGEK
jgi:hypothetical protein